jgi:hypothetical protein
MTRENMDWQELSTTSHYQTAVAIEQELQKGHVKEAAAGVRELIDALGRSEKRALKSQLIRLMAHIIKWQTQPEKRTQGWAATIYNAREEIKDIQSETPSLSDATIREMWDRCFQSAKREAEGDMNQRSSVQALSWKEVFEDQYEMR